MASNLPLFVRENQSIRWEELDHLNVSLMMKYPVKQSTLSSSLWAKRVMDLVITIPGTIILLPAFLVIGILIKLDSEGPVFFRQQRVGRNGQSFQIYKFRTMEVGTEKLKKYFIIENDEKITKVGKILRKLKLDELPQIYNVLKGEMSLVGPRPMIPQIVAKYPKQVKKIVFSVPPGITGLASLVYIDESEILNSVSNPEQLYTEEIIPAKLHYYLYYVKNHNLWLDLKIILLTFVYLFQLFFCMIRGEEYPKFRLKLK